MEYNIIYKQPVTDTHGAQGHKIWLVQGEDAGYVSAIGGCLMRGLADGESLEIHARLPKLEPEEPN